MKKMKQLLFLLLMGLSISSCSKKFQFQDAEPFTDRSYFHEDDAISINTYFAGDAVQYLIFELDITNKSEDTITLYSENVHLRVAGDPLNSRQALSKEIILEDIDYAETDLKRERKEQNIESAVGVGLSILGAIATGSSELLAESIVYSIDAAAYTLEGNRSYKLIEGSLEEKKQFANEWVLGEATLLPAEKKSFDLLFDPTLIDNRVVLEIECMGKIYAFDYDFFIGEEKVNR